MWMGPDTTTVYEKGAEVIRMIHTLLGEQTFRRGMDMYFDAFDGQVGDLSFMDVFVFGIPDA